MLSKRLETVAETVTKGNIVADIGTDHGYVPIYLIKNKISPMVYALDINEGPLKMAEKNISREGLKDKIKLIQSDGMEKLKEGMVETVVITGMGGELIVEILEKSKINHTIKELILSPHKKPELVRRYLLENGWIITEEKMVGDGGKYYLIIKACRGVEESPYKEWEYIYGRCLLKRKDSVLKDYLDVEQKKLIRIINNIKKSGGNGIDELERRLKNNMEGEKAYD